MKSKFGQFLITFTLVPLGANTPDGFQHSGYAEQITLHVDSIHLNFSATAQSLKQAKEIAISSLKKYHAPADIRGEIEYYVDRRIADQWIKPGVNGGWKKKGTRCSPYEYKTIKACESLLNIPLFAFSNNDEFGNGLQSVKPFTGTVFDNQRGRREGFSPIHGEGGAMTKKSKAWSMTEEDWQWLESQANQSETIRKAIALLRHQ